MPVGFLDGLEEKAFSCAKNVLKRRREITLSIANRYYPFSLKCHCTGTGMSRSSPNVGKLALIWGHFRSKPCSSTGPVSDFKDAGILLTSTVGKAIEGVPFVAGTCECARVVDAAVITGPVQRAFIHICNCKGRGHLKPTLRDAWQEHIYNLPVTGGNNTNRIKHYLGVLPLTCVFFLKSVEQPTISILPARTLLSKFCCKLHCL